LHLLETRLKAIQLSPYHADPPAPRSLRLDTTAGFLACYFPLFTFRLLGQPSDPETSPLVPARYAGDTTLRLVAQLQHAAASQSAAAASAASRIADPQAGSRQDPTTTGPRRPDQPARTGSLKPQFRRPDQIWNPTGMSSRRASAAAVRACSTARSRSPVARNAHERVRRPRARNGRAPRSVDSEAFLQMRQGHLVLATAHIELAERSGHRPHMEHGAGTHGDRAGLAADGSATLPASASLGTGASTRCP
jgi:hypothetical protein